MFPHRLYLLCKTLNLSAFGCCTNDDVALPTITLAVSPSSVTEDGSSNLVYTFTRTGVISNALTVNYTVGGTATNGSDYGTIGTSVTFAANSSTATVTVDPTADTTVESDETVSLTLASGTGYTIGTTSAVTGTITNDDTQVTLAVSPSSVTEDGSSNLVYTFTRTGVISNALTVNYTVGGTATNGSDYGTIGTSVTFAANSSTATVTVDPTADTTVESDETVSLTLASGTGYTIGTTSAVTGTITNDDILLPVITLTVFPSSVTEDGPQNLFYTFIRSGDTANALTVNYTVGGTATFNSDYTQREAASFTNTSGSITFAPGASTATFIIDPASDTVVEGNESVSISLTFGNWIHFIGRHPYGKSSTTRKSINFWSDQEEQNQPTLMESSNLSTPTTKSTIGNYPFIASGNTASACLTMVMQYLNTWMEKRVGKIRWHFGAKPRSTKNYKTS